MGKIFFSSGDKIINLINRKRVKNFISLIFYAEKVDFEKVRFIFCSDDYLLLINQKHLNHDYLTDVISFVLSNTEQPLIGEVYLSIDRIKQNANNFNVSYQNELLRVLIHGSLHVIGYEDKNIISKKQMTKLEDFYLDKFNFT